MATPIANTLSLEDLVLKLYEIGAVKFGKFTLKSGVESPVYFDLRVIISYPQLMKDVSDYLWEAAQGGGCGFVSVCGVPYTALPLATCISAKYNLPMLIRRKEAKDYGTKKMIEGHYNKGDECLIVEDVVTSGSSVLETMESLNTEGIIVKDAVVLLDRDQGGKAVLEKHGIKLQSVCSLTKVLEILEKLGKLDSHMVERCHKFIGDNRFDTKVAPVTKRQIDKETDHTLPQKVAKQTHSYLKRASLCKHPIVKQLFTIMDAKKSNLALSADLTKTADILDIVDRVGPYICVVKTHVDILEDFSQDFVEKLSLLAQKHDFIIFEDRKFADIGNTVLHQYQGGLYRIADWAHIVNAHSVPGDGVVKGLREVGLPRNRGCLLIAEMSSSGSLATGSYTEATVKMAEEHSDFVVGFICQSHLSADPGFVHMSPGIQLKQGTDSLGQNYVTPRDAIVSRKTDIIIVGRGILKAEDPVAMAKLYQEAGHQAYLELLS